MVSQHHIEMLRDHMDISATQYLTAHFSNVKEVDARSHLGLFGLAGELALQPVGKLSGGQKARLALAIVMWEKPHVLILDEPTNHLDIDSIEILEHALAGFKGGILAVSHDDRFLKAIGCEQGINLKKLSIDDNIEKQ